jgi:3',5'-cyclic AMP phosphodiesterase CpdA
MKAVEEPVVVVVPGDLHLTERGLDNFEAGHRVVDAVNTLIRPDFVQFIGDNVQDATTGQFELFDEIRNRLEVPHFALIGDHDIKDDPAASQFRLRIGDPFYATRLRGFRFLRLNTQEFRPTGISGEQVAWLRNELDRARVQGERVIIFQHNYPYQIWEEFAGPGIDDWRGLVQTHRVEAIICGHTHYWQVANDGRNALIAVRSIGDPEGGSAGYGVFYFHGDDFAATYRSIDDQGPLVLITHPRERLLATSARHIVSGPDKLIARVWSTAAVEGVRYRINDSPWTGLESWGEGHWQSRIAGDRLSKGEHTLEVVARAVDGSEGLDRIHFMVDRTGRYTAVPEVRPSVSATQFC